MSTEKKYDPRVSTTLSIASAITGLLTILTFFGSLWYWAVNDMSDRVGTAWFFSVFVLGFMTVFGWMGASSTRDETK